MGNYLVILPLVAAITGLGIGLFTRLLLLKRAPAWFARRSPFFVQEFLTGEVIRSTLAGSADPATFLPIIEAHIDDFLRNRLGKAIPMVGMFIGEKTIAEMKNVFMIELTGIFPLIMDKYAEELASGPDIRERLHKKLAGIPSEKITLAFKKNMSHELVMIPLWTMAAGFITGLLQCLVLWWIS